VLSPVSPSPYRWELKTRKSDGRMERCMFLAAVFFGFIAQAERQVARDSVDGLEEECDILLLQTVFAVANASKPTLSSELGPDALPKERDSRSFSLLSVLSLEVEKNASSSSNLTVMLLVALAMVFIIPLIVYLLSDSSSYLEGPGGKLLERGSLGPRREAPWTSSVKGSEPRLSIQASQALAMPPTALARPRPDEDPPKLCENLILPKHLAIFLVDAERLKNPGFGPFPIWGGSGKQLLQADLQDRGPEGVQLWIWPVNLDSPAAVVLQRRSSMQSGLEIYNRDNQLYGFLENAGGRMMLMCNGFPVMAVDGNADALTYTACRVNGSMLASASVVSENLRVDDVREGWKLQVKPGVDAIVIMCAFLSSILLNRRSGTFTPSLPSASPRVSILSQASHPRA